MSDENFRKTTLFRTPPAEETLPLKLHIFNFAVVEGGTYTVRRHRHAESEIMLPLEGFYRTRLNGTLLRVPPGNFLLVQSGDLHEDFCRGKFRFAAFRFRFEDADSFPRELPICRPELDAAFRIFPLRKESLPMELFRQIVLRAPEEQIFRRVALGNLAETFFWELLATLPEEILADPLRRVFQRNVLLTRLEQLFSAHMGESMTGEQIAGALGMSRRVLEYKLKQAGAPSPLRLFNCCRIREAIHLLKYEGLNVSQTAEKLGFATPYHFSRVFRSITGVPPSKCFSLS